MEIRISFSNVVGKRLALGYTHCLSSFKRLTVHCRNYLIVSNYSRRSLQNAEIELVLICLSVSTCPLEGPRPTRHTEDVDQSDKRTNNSRQTLLIHFQHCSFNNEHFIFCSSSFTNVIVKIFDVEILLIVVTTTCA